MAREREVKISHVATAFGRMKLLWHEIVVTWRGGQGLAAAYGDSSPLRGVTQSITVFQYFDVSHTEVEALGYWQLAVAMARPPPSGQLQALLQLEQSASAVFPMGYTTWTRQHTGISVVLTITQPPCTHPSYNPPSPPATSARENLPHA
ncbi:hypothetical protein VOLCADRAFT_87974, partial [Volvox carteri f. nagariensis]